jgi:hypothetical protein
MITGLRALAAAFIVASAVVLFAFEPLGKLFAILLIVGCLLSLVATWLERRA